MAKADAGKIVTNKRENQRRRRGNESARKKPCGPHQHVKAQLTEPLGDLLHRAELFELQDGDLRNGRSFLSVPMDEEGENRDVHQQDNEPADAETGILFLGHFQLRLRGI